MQTVTGELARISGAVLPHEHLVLDLRTEKDREGYLNHDETVTEELSSLYQGSNRLALVVDQTCRGMGRDARRLRTISNSSGVPIVCATGWYYRRFHPEGEPGNLSRAIDTIYRELTTSVDETIDDAQPIRAGIIGEVGTHADEPDEHEKVSLEAAARVSQAEGTPIATHAHLGTGAMAQMKIFETHDVDLTRVLIGHQDLFNESSQHVAIAKSGAFLGFDTAGKVSYQSDHKRAELIAAVIEAGYLDQVLLSNDISRYSYLESEGGQGYHHCFDTMRTLLMKIGLSDEEYRRITASNPARWLGVDVVD
ncbi:phosphotriesterase family protein [Boudabousia marimammalium]|uniref:Phosphotriesterase n=1 Tax=Boudabousia marimammalium TaxID=156892 RepID=A0A1Q5PSY2_9ACTO|nr:hypothetical protein [Boudabousia marimammalium]OKL50480.1 hypothetical protein BM477_00450 [Boudabousia marimammalium]